MPKPEESPTQASPSALPVATYLNLSFFKPTTDCPTKSMPCMKADYHQSIYIA